jgi:hypothetical protein
VGRKQNSNLCAHLCILFQWITSPSVTSHSLEEHRAIPCSSLIADKLKFLNCFSFPSSVISYFHFTQCFLDFMYPISPFKLHIDIVFPRRCHILLNR